MLRKRILGPPTAAEPYADEIRVEAAATVAVTSELPEHPIDHAFDARRGPGGSRWVAAEPGEQTVLLAFDEPQTLRQITLEVEELEVARRQEFDVCVSSDGGRTYRELVRQEYNFSPPGTTFEREQWAVEAPGVTHLRIRIKPDKGAVPCRATLTTLALR